MGGVVSVNTPTLPTEMQCLNRAMQVDDDTVFLSGQYCAMYSASDGCKVWKTKPSGRDLIWCVRVGDKEMNYNYCVATVL